MRLKSIELIGFKSFVDRTILQFESGITGVVGPNGSGKSNVVDAIRWVMGEQSAKHLRGGEMLDVIFAGTQHRPAMGMASVFLTFDNGDGRAPAEYAEYAEITVGRRLYRSGESEYFINKIPCRLKDVVDLFLGTGTGTKAYSIVEQGRIGQIVGAKPEERRLLLEEAAGISKFRHRREMAQRRMEATRQNLTRLQDIVQELQRQLGSLQRQAKKAEKFRELSNELRGIELGVAAQQWITWEQELTQRQGAFEQDRTEETTLAAQLAEAETTTEQQRLELTAIEQELTTVQQQYYGLQNQLQLCESRIGQLMQEVREREQLSAGAEREIAELEAKVHLWREALQQANEVKLTSDVAVAQAQDDLQQGETELAAHKQTLQQIETHLQQGEHARREAERTHSAAVTRLEALTQREGPLTQATTEAEAAVVTTTQQLQTVQRRITDERAAVAAREQQSLQLGEERSTLEAALTELQREFQSLTTEATERRATTEQIKSRLESLEELQRNFEGYGEGAKAILRAREAGDGAPCAVLGTLAEILTVEPQYEAAVAALAGERLQAVLVEQPEAAAAAIAYLKTGALGRGSFVAPITRPFTASPGLAGARSNSEGIAESTDDETLPTGDGVLGWLTSFLQLPEPFAALTAPLFGRTVVVTTLADGLSTWQQHATPLTYVTLDGELIHPSGMVTGGSGGEAAQAILARRRECEQLRAALHTAQTALAAATELTRRCQERLDQVNQRLTAVAQSRHDEELQLTQQRTQLRHAEQEQQRVTKELDAAQQRVQRLRAEGETLRTEHSALTADLAALEQRRQLAGQSIEGLREQEAGLRRLVEQLGEQLGRARANLAAQQERSRTTDDEIQRLLGTMTAASTSVAAKQAAIADGRIANTEAQDRLLALQTERAEVARTAETRAAEQQEIQRRFHQTSDAIREREAVIRTARHQYEAAGQRKHQAELAIAQQQERMNYLRHEIFEKYRLEIHENPAQHIRPDVDMAVATERVETLREKIAALGGVNVDAIQEYEELQSRHVFLTQQSADLEASMESLHRAITKINRVSRERFIETFEAINERFQRLFPKLFRGGSAQLILSDTESPLEAGVEIIAQPPGKKLQNMTLLSGGEKALTAVAMIFAMFLVRPSPFCLLDEVDAPLDDANIDRFNDLVREMTQYAQFILITHNKRTMELADTLYGVTMQEPGISKIVAVRLTGQAEPAEGPGETAAA